MKNRSRRLKVAAAAVIIAGGVAAATLTPASASVTYNSGGLVLEAMPQSPANLLARGAAVDVTVEYSCSASYPVSMSLMVAEHVGGNGLASGSTTVSLSCTGGNERTVVTVVAFGDRAFSTGKAFAQATIYGCNYFTCGSENGSATISIRK